jgi:hypothetical protein
MNVKSWVILVGAAGITAATAGCKDQSVRDYLKTGGAFYSHVDTLGLAICDLQRKNTGQGLDPRFLMCTSGPPDKKSVPGYPP